VDNVVVGVVVGSGARFDILQQDPLSTRVSTGSGQSASGQQHGAACRHAAIVAPGAKARNKTAISRILVERWFKKVTSVPG